MDTVKKAYELALCAQKKAYAPYSKFKVGSAVKIKGKDEFFFGNNVENASNGASVCADRIAIYSAFAKYGQCELEFMVVVSEMDPPIPPCALCLQVMAEFCPPDFPIHLANLDGVKDTVTFKELLPRPYSSFIPNK